jgi:HEAT repeat protein
MAMAPDDEALDTRGRNVTLGVFGAIVLLIAGLVLNNYRVKQDRIAGMKSPDVARQAAKVKEMMRGFTNDGHIAEQLQGERPSVRVAAVRSLAALKDDPDPQIRKDAARLTVPFLKDSDAAIRDLAVQSLTAMGPETAMEAVTSALGDSDGNVKSGAQTVCQNFAPDSIPPLLAFTGKDGATARLRTAHRTNAGNALVEIWKRNKENWNTVILFGEEAVGARRAGLSSAQAAAALQRFLELERPLLIPPDTRVFGVVEYLNPARANEDDQNNAISILDRVADRRAVPYLLPRLASPTTRRAAVGALGRLGDRRATAALLELLPRDETNRLDVVIALGRIADPASIEALIRHGLGSVSQPVRAAAADSLRNIGAPAVPALIAAARGRDATDPDFYRAEGATRALAGIRVPAATAVAVEGLRHPAPNVREAAAAALADSGDPSVVAPLIASFTDTDGRVAGFAARSISAYGTRAIPPLVAALSDPARVYWASLAIGYIGPAAVPALQEKVLHGDARGALAAAKLLGDMSDPRAVSTLKEAMSRRNDPDFAFAAQSSIQRLGGA